jgi:hypothetical protein
MKSMRQPQAAAMDADLLAEPTAAMALTVS